MGSIELGKRLWCDFITHAYKYYQGENINKKQVKVLDIGAGAGIYRFMLRNIQNGFDAVEIHKPYIEQFNIEQFYDKVYNCDAVDFDKYNEYDIIICGDMLEHLTIERAQQLIKKIKTQSPNSLTFICVPYEYEQTAIRNNKYEIHLQPDLTRENVKIRYPELKEMIIFSHHGLGYYLLGKQEKINEVFQPCNKDCKHQH